MTWQLSPPPPGLPWRQGAICALLVGALGFGGWRLFDYRQQEQNYQAILNRVEALKLAQDYRACEQQASQIPPWSRYAQQAQHRGQECKQIQAAFDQAQKLAEAGQYNLAIDRVSQIVDPTATTLVNQRISLWSEQTLQKAQRIYDDRNGRFEEALEVAGWIKPNNPFYQQAQTKIQTLTDHWTRNAAYWNAAQTALNNRQFDVALAQIQQIDHPYWQQQALPIASEISVYTSVIAALPSPQPVQSDQASGYVDANLTQVVTPGQTDDSASGGATDGGAAGDSGTNGGADGGANGLDDSYGNWLGDWSGEPGADVASLTLKFLIPLSVPLMLGLRRPRN